ncbi:MAG: cadmium-translocating P-type ATPase [Lewinellaceae bacterium]|nr:cadmium-translocating P-type ATPase [Saprospiraceae bacterium]MCB9345756.1 cadmium-translocating P-type ATPase [Lewinellaceae bacterium]
MGTENAKQVLKRFPVTGMSCAGCAANIERTLKNQSGVFQASVNFADKTAQVEYDPDSISPEKLCELVQGVGYGMIVEDSREAKEMVKKMEEDNYEQLRKRTIWAAVFTVPLVILGMFFMDAPGAKIAMWALATPMLAWFGRDFFINAWKQARVGAANMDTLVALSTGIAYVFSVFNTLYPQFWTSRGLTAHVYFEAAGVIITFILLGKLLEERAKAKTSSALKSLMSLKPKMLTLIDQEGLTKEIPISEVKVGNVILVKPGEKIPVDGHVLEGNSYVDESLLSGEPVPVLKEKNSKVWAGSLNQKGSLQFAAEKVGSETMLSQIIQRVQEAQGSKAPVQKLADRIAGIFVPAVMLIAIITFFAWWIWGGPNGLNMGILAMVTVLVIACPCALGLATPTAIMVGIGKGATEGILIKDAASLELANKIDILVLDKTGTITKGEPQVTEVVWEKGIDEDYWQQVFYSLEMRSEHPLAEAIVHHFKKSKAQQELDNVESISGKGIQAMHKGKMVLTGNHSYIQENKLELSEYLSEKTVKWNDSANTLVYFANLEKVLGVATISDPIKEGSKDAIQELKQMGIAVHLLSGDKEESVAVVASQVGITDYQSAMLPSGKEDFISKLQSEGKIVAMAGDGINDSQALARANVSIAMGKGSDIAKEVAQLTLISNDLDKIPAAIRLSRKTVATIRQNLFWAFVYNLIGIPIAAGLLYPINGFMLNPMIAGAAMAMSSVSVVSNSLRLKWAV